MFFLTLLRGQYDAELQRQREEEDESKIWR